MIVDREIAFTGNIEIEQSVPGEELEHVIKER